MSAGNTGFATVATHEQRRGPAEARDHTYRVERHSVALLKRERGP